MAPVRFIISSMAKTRFRGYCAAGCGSSVFSGNERAKYCSVTCAYARYGERKACPVCGKIVRTKKKVYCSLACHHRQLHDNRCAMLENGTYPQVTSNNFIRRYLIERYGPRCAKCGWAQRHPVTGNVPVEVEHIDGDWTNNALDISYCCVQTATRLRPRTARSTAAGVVRRDWAAGTTRCAQKGINAAPKQVEGALPTWRSG